MKKTGRPAALLVLAILASLIGQRLAGANFLPTAAVEGQTTERSVEGLTTSRDILEAPRSDLVTRSALEAPVTPTVSPPAADAAATAAPTEVSSAPEPAAGAAAASAQAVPSVGAPSPMPAVAATAVAAPVAPVAPAPAATAAPAGCPSTWFCYPRLGITGSIVPYSDCGGTTDIGTTIRSFTCISPFYLMGHAYTQFGQITQWRAGDIVYVSGRLFVISGAFTQSSCAAPARTIAPLSLQTSLTSGACGSVLVVQGS